MGLTAFNLARRRVLQAHLAVVVPELPTVSEVSAPEPSDAVVVAPTAVDVSSPPPTAANPTLVLRVYPALTLINSATTVEQLTVLPTVGRGAAKVILDERVEPGYVSLAALPAAIFAKPYRCDLEQIKAWEG